MSGREPFQKYLVQRFSSTAGVSPLYTKMALYAAMRQRHFDPNRLSTVAQLGIKS